MVVHVLINQLGNVLARQDLMVLFVNNVHQDILIILIVKVLSKNLYSLIMNRKYQE